MQRSSAQDANRRPTLLHARSEQRREHEQSGRGPSGSRRCLWAPGRLREAIPYVPEIARRLRQAPRAGGAGFVIIHAYDMAIDGSTTRRRSAMRPVRRPRSRRVHHSWRSFASSEPKGSMALSHRRWPAETSPPRHAAFERDDLATPSVWPATMRVDMRSHEAERRARRNLRNTSACSSARMSPAVPNIMLGNFAAAEQAERGAIEARKRTPIEAIARSARARRTLTWLAMALARQGRTRRGRAGHRPGGQIPAGACSQESRRPMADRGIRRRAVCAGPHRQEHGAPLLREAAAKLDALPADIARRCMTCAYGAIASSRRSRQRG